MGIVKKYKGLDVTIKGARFSDEDIDKQIEILLNQNAKQIAKEGKVENGDTTIIAFEGFKDGVPFAGGKSDGYELKIGSHTFIPGFEEGMIGMEKGETRELHLTFPENYGAADLAGKEVVFKVTVKDIFTSEKPELSDAFVVSLQMPDIDTVDKLKEYVRNAMMEASKRENQNRASLAIMEELINNTELELSEAEMIVALETQLENVKAQLAQQGATLEQYVEMNHTTLEAFKETLKPFAVKQTKLDKALEEIADLEKIEVLEEEVEEQLKLIAAQFQADIEEVKKQVPVDEIRKEILMNKSNSIVLNNANIHVK